MGTLVTLAGLAWNPEISGILVVATGFVVLLGSVWFIIVTNSGIRLATLMAAAALMGWMAILGSAWWMYGSGWKGADPSWQTVDINVGDLNASGVPEARLLPDPYIHQALPRMAIQPINPAKITSVACRMPVLVATTSQTDPMSTATPVPTTRMPLISRSNVRPASTSRLVITGPSRRRPPRRSARG